MRVMDVAGWLGAAVAGGLAWALWRRAARAAAGWWWRCCSRRRWRALDRTPRRATIASAYRTDPYRADADLWRGLVNSRGRVYRAAVPDLTEAPTSDLTP